MEKRGVGHVEIILAFLIFISSVLFIFYYFNVGKITANNDATLAFLEEHLGQITRVELSTTTFVVDSAHTQDIVKVHLPAPLLTGQSVRAEDYERNRLQSKIGSDRQTIYVDRHVNLLKTQFIRILASSDIDETMSLIDMSAVDSTHISALEGTSTDNRQILSERQLLRLNATYYYNYIKLKKTDIGLSDRTDFAFKIRLPNVDGGETLINAERTVPSRVEVSALTRRLEVLRSGDGRRVFADFVIRVW